MSSDDVEDFDMEVVEEDELDELGAGSTSGSEKRGLSDAANTERSDSSKPEMQNNDSAIAKEGTTSTNSKNQEDGGAQRFGPFTLNIPEEWRAERKGKVKQLFTRGKQPTYVEDGVPVINQECIYWNDWHFENLRYLDREEAEEWSEKYFPKKGDIILNSTGQGTLGRAQVYPDEERRAVDSHVTILRTTDDLNPHFHRYFLESHLGQALLYSMCVNGSTGQIELSKTRLDLMPVPIPPLPEQRKIASVLYTVDQAIQKTGAIIEQAQRVKRGLIQDLLTCGIDKDGNRRDPESDLFQSTSLGKFPEAWKLKPLNSIVTESITYGIVQPGPNIPGGVPFIRSGDATADRLDPSSLQRTSEEIAESYSRSRVNAGEIITTIRATVGESHQVPESLDGANLGRGVARIVPEGTVNRRFLLWAMRSGYMDRQFNMYMKGSTYSEITLEQLGKLRVALPDADEQHRIANVLDVQEQNIENEQERLNELRSLKKGLMQDLLTGEVRTADKAIDVLEEVELEEVEAHG